MKELILIQSELKAPKSQFNSFGNYKYRNCEDILEALKPLLIKQGCYINLTDEIINLGERFYVKATVTLTNQENVSISSTALAREAETKKGMDEAQITGSTSSYARKYALNGLLAIDDTKDADFQNNSVLEKTKASSNLKNKDNFLISEKQAGLLFVKMRDAGLGSYKLKNDYLYEFLNIDKINQPDEKEEFKALSLMVKVVEFNELIKKIEHLAEHKKKGN